MFNNTLKNLCIFRLVYGLFEGLSSFSGHSRAALIYAEKPDDAMRIYDPQALLRSHESELYKIYLTSKERREDTAGPEDFEGLWSVYPEKNPRLPGLISYGARTASIFHQMWFTEHHPNICSTGPTEKWLEHAVSLLAHDFANANSIYLGSSRYVIREYKTHAIRDYIRDELYKLYGWESQLEMYRILDAILGISKTPEEGSWPRGRLGFIEPREIPKVRFLARFPDLQQPDLGNYKHTRKLLIAVEDSERMLVSDGKNVIGVAKGAMPDCRITADFLGDHGFLRFSGKPVCSFSDGSFHSFNHRPNLVTLKHTLLRSSPDPTIGSTLYAMVATMTRNTETFQHGCTIVLDLNEEPVQIAGQVVDHPLDLRDEKLFQLAKSLGNIDGAIHIRPDLHLHAFACLLDGRCAPREDRSKGARFNSALRFTAQHQNVIVVVVSADRRVSVIQDGLELTAQCEWKPFSDFVTTPPTLEEWVETDSVPQ